MPELEIIVVWNVVIAMTWRRAGGFRLHFGSRTEGLADECGREGKEGTSEECQLLHLHSWTGQRSHDEKTMIRRLKEKRLPVRQPTG